MSFILNIPYFIKPVLLNMLFNKKFWIQTVHYLCFIGAIHKGDCGVHEYHYVFEPCFEQGELCSIRANLYINNYQYLEELYSLHPGNPLSETIQNIKVLTPNLVLRCENKHRYILRATKEYRGNVAQISYDIKVPKNLDSPFQSGLCPDVIYLNAQEALLCPAFYYVKNPIKASVTWYNLPAGWTAAGSQGVEETQYFEGAAVDLKHCYFIAGEWDFQSIKIEMTNVVVACHKALTIATDKLMHSVKQIVLANYNFIPSFYHPPFYLFAFMENKKSLQYGGRAYHNGSFIILPKGISSVELNRLMAHEYFHQWNPSAFYGRGAYSHGSRWFTEGLTDYYANLLCFRQGLITPNHWLDFTNRAIQQYYSSELLQSDNKELKDVFSKKYHSFPYEKGLVLALYINQKIKEYNAAYSLDDFFKKLLLYTNTTKQKLSFTSIITVLANYVSKDILEEIYAIVKQGKVMSLNAFTLGDGVDTIDQSIKSLWTVGINLEQSLKQGYITFVKPLSAAEHAGLYRGQKIFSGKIENNLLVITVERKGQSETVTIPLYKTITFPRYKLQNSGLLMQNWSK